MSWIVNSFRGNFIPCLCYFYFQNIFAITSFKHDFASHDDVIKWKHFSALLAICAGNSPVSGEFPARRPVTRSFDVLFDLRPNKRLSNQWWGWWFETLSHPFWRHCNEMWMNSFIVVGNLEMDKQFHPTFYNGCNFLSMQGLKLISVSKRGPYIQVMIDVQCVCSNVLTFPMSGLWTLMHAIVTFWIYSDTSVYTHPWHKISHSI